MLGSVGRKRKPKPPKNAAAVALGKKRWRGYTAEERRAAAKRAIAARWAKRKASGREA
jgi:hypothetical protein